MLRRCTLYIMYGQIVQEKLTINKIFFKPIYLLTLGTSVENKPSIFISITLIFWLNSFMLHTYCIVYHEPSIFHLDWFLMDTDKIDLSCT